MKQYLTDFGQQVVQDRGLEVKVNRVAPQVTLLTPVSSLETVFQWGQGRGNPNRALRRGHRIENQETIATRTSRSEYSREEQCRERKHIHKSAVFSCFFEYLTVCEETTKPEKTTGKEEEEERSLELTQS